MLVPDTGTVKIGRTGCPSFGRWPLNPPSDHGNCNGCIAGSDIALIERSLAVKTETPTCVALKAQIVAIVRVFMFSSEDNP